MKKFRHFNSLNILNEDKQRQKLSFTDDSYKYYVPRWKTNTKCDDAILNILGYTATLL